MIVYWLGQAAAEVPADNAWLSAREVDRMAGMRFPKRRADWRLGRWTAKKGVAAYLEIGAGAVPLADIEIRTAESGAPEVFLRDEPAPLSISLTHCCGRAVCAVAVPAGAALGCDLEAVEPRGEAFLGDYFTADEQELVRKAPAAEQAMLVTVLWSAKESALKALHVGLRRDTHSVVVRLTGTRCPEWSPLKVYSTEDGRHFPGWWRNEEGFVLTVAADPPPAAPVSFAELSTV